MKAKLPSTREYAQFVTELKQRIASARLHAARAVNRDLVLLYWDIGKGIVERQAAMGWGDSVVEALAKDLQKDFPGISGFSARNPWHMRRFYSAYSDTQFLQQAVAESPWGHHLQVLNKVEARQPASITTVPRRNSVGAALEPRLQFLLNFL
jgi:predicted nuclease of restriction endonuclease-like (RecB) superfamily